ncbi:MAG: B12-binding domain-containing radical SAM protein [Flavobacteriales bacterium]|nr:B12-binding domain-containing radical SAM protein [Flavobacteriales bacterium]
MKVCLIKPPVLYKAVSVSLMPSPPLGLAYIAGALVAAGHEVSVIDATAEGLSRSELFEDGIYLFGLNARDIIDRMDPDAEVICFSFMFTNNWLYDRHLVAEVRRAFPHAIMVAGGEHATAAPEFCLHQAPGLDHIVLGEGEATIIDLLTNCKNPQDVDGIVYRDGDGIRVNRKGSVKRISAIGNIARPAWELFPLSKYFENGVAYGIYRGRTLPVMASRGCPYDCTFCSSPQMWGRTYSIREPEDFVDELEMLRNNHGVTNFELYDLTAIIHREWIIRTAKEIIRRNLNITYQIPAGTRAEAIDLEVAEYLYRSGCKNITYAPESGSVRVLKDIRKKVKLDRMLKSIRESNRAGLNIKLNIIIGFPDETHLDIWKTIWFLVKASWHGANDTSPAVFSPYPGSRMFDDLLKKGQVDLYDDRYIKEIINSYDLWPGKVYAECVSPFFVRLYTLVIMALFYGSNFLFRPIRLFHLMRNVMSDRHESRLELFISKSLIRGRSVRTTRSAVHSRTDSETRVAPVSPHHTLH